MSTAPLNYGRDELATLAYHANCNYHSRTEASFGQTQLREMSSRSRGHRLLLFMGERTPTQIQLSFVMATKTKARLREEVLRAPVPVGSLSSHSPGNHSSVLAARYMVDLSVPALDRSSKSLLWVKLAERKPQPRPEGSLVHSPCRPSSLAKFTRLQLAPCGEGLVGAAGLSSVHLIHSRLTSHWFSFEANRGIALQFKRDR